MRELSFDEGQIYSCKKAFSKGQPVVKLILALVLLGMIGAAKAMPQFTFYTEHLPPLQMQFGDEPVKGITVDVAKLMGKQLGIEVNVQVIPWGRAYQLTKTLPNVILFSVHKSKKREKDFHWLGRVLKRNHMPSKLLLKDNELIAWQRVGDGLRADSLEGLKQYVVCAGMHDALTQQLLNTHDWPRSKMTFAIGWPQALEMFFAKRCNVFIARKTFMKEYLIGTGRTMKDIEPITSLAKYFEAPDFHFAISKATNPRYVRMLSEALTKAKASPDYDKLVAKWYRLMRLTSQN